jgi:hypothetical protein
MDDRLSAPKRPRGKDVIVHCASDAILRRVEVTTCWRAQLDQVLELLAILLEEESTSVADSALRRHISAARDARDAPPELIFGPSQRHPAKVIHPHFPAGLFARLQPRGHARMPSPPVPEATV